jgi:hypothetical protein
MAARFGNVLCWAAIIPALIHVGLAIHVWTQPVPKLGTVWALIIFAMIIFLIGRTFRYVPAGR